jgi:hypothetical protein
MIISASRRTDIPAFYAEWFITRLKSGYLLTRNPLNRKQVSRINLSPDVIDCIVFWTKNPEPILKYLPILDSYNYYFHFTLNSYNSAIEMNLPDKSKLIESFKRLSDTIGPERVIWRYDPVFYTDKHDYSFHINNFENLSKSLSGYTSRCMYSFLTVYQKCEKNMKEIYFARPSIDDIIKISEAFSNISASSGIRLQTCAENLDLTEFGITKGKCIDNDLISKISGKQVSIPKDRNQRESCLCVSSIDIGAYNTCPHRCIYCYANYNHDLAIQKYRNHNPGAEIITGDLGRDEIIKEKREVNKNNDQLKLF